MVQPRSVVSAGNDRTSSFSTSISRPMSRMVERHCTGRFSNPRLASPHRRSPRLARRLYLSRVVEASKFRERALALPWRRLPSLRSRSITKKCSRSSSIQSATRRILLKSVATPPIDWLPARRRLVSRRAGGSFHFFFKQRKRIEIKERQRVFSKRLRNVCLIAKRRLSSSSQGIEIQPITR